MSDTLSNKERLECLLAGGVPGTPPHFEIDFQLADKMFGMAQPKSWSSEAERRDRLLGFHLDLQTRLVDELGYASVAFTFSLPPELSLARTKKVLGHKALLRSYDWDGVFWMPTGGNLEAFVVRLYEDPEGLHREARAKCDRAKERLRVHAGEGTEFFLLAYDFGFNNGPFISPAHFKEFVTPYLTEIVSACHDLGMKAILHSDGDLRLILDQIHSTGLDGYQSVDPQAHMDIKTVREQYPDWILMGNVQCSLLQDVNEKAIRDSVRYCMAHGGMGKRYIFSTSNCIFEGMPPQSYRIMLDEYRGIMDAANARRPE